MWIQNSPTWLIGYFKTSKFLFSQVHTLKSSSCQNPSFQSEHFQNLTKTTSLWLQHQNLQYPSQISHHLTLLFLSNNICFYFIPLSSYLPVPRASLMLFHAQGRHNPDCSHLQYLPVHSLLKCYLLWTLLWQLYLKLYYVTCSGPCPSVIHYTFITIILIRIKAPLFVNTDKESRHKTGRY